MQNQYFVIKNSILNYNLSAMDITVYSALVSMINGKTKSIVSKYSAIANRANVSQQSAVRSIKTLCEKGLIKKQIRKNSEGHYMSCRYRIVNLFSKYYTILPMSIWDYNLSPSAYLLHLYLSSKCNEFGECFPSLRQIRTDVNLSLSTISKSIKEIKEKDLIIKEYYITKSSDFGHNQYTVLSKIRNKNKNPRSNNYKKIIVEARKQEFNVVSFYTNRLDTNIEFCILKQLAA